MNVILDLTKATEEEWLAGRADALTGSDCLALLGLDPNRSRFALWAEKTGGATRDFEETEAMRWGHRLERIIAEEFADRENLPVVKADVLVEHRLFPFMRATPDYLIPRTDEILEIKNAGQYKAHEWADGQIPLRATAQVMWYLAVCEKPSAWVAALIGGNRLEIRRVERDDELIAYIAQQAQEFWFEYVEPKNMPPIDATDSTSDAIAQLFPRHADGKVVDLSPETALLFEKYLVAKADETAAKERVKQYGNELRVALGDAERAAYEGRELLTFRAHTQKRLDVDAFKEAHPALAAEFTREIPVRPLRIIKHKEK